MSKKGKKDKFEVVKYSDLNHKLYKRNLKAIQKIQPKLSVNLEKIKETFSDLVVNQDGQFDIRFRESQLQESGHNDWAKKRIDEFKNQGRTNRLRLSPIDTDNLDDETNIAGYRLMKRAVEQDIQFLSEPNDLSAYHVLVLGVGLGVHLPGLFEETQCKNIILIEPNLEFLFWSLYVFDWVAFCKSAKKAKCRIIFIHVPTANEIMDRCVNNVRIANPASVDGLLFFSTYKSSVMDNAHKLMLENRNLFNIGLGFIEDEIDMIRNSYRNLVNFEGHYFETQKETINPLPAFVIGAGPSLDNDLEYIRENQDKALIISCGTSLRILLKNGIVPDFQMEMENVTAVTDLMTTLSKDFDLSKIRLVASNTVDPGVPKFFDKTLFYIRSGLSSFPIFAVSPGCCISYSTPTVSNLGFSFAQEIGCRNIYVFGVDLGARDAKKHHAKDAAYNTGELVFATEINMPVAGNFGGDVLSEKIYLWGRTVLEVAMQRLPNHNYVNCSDGAAVEGMLPKLSSTIKLDDFEDKAAVIEDLFSKFPAYTHEHFEQAWNRYDLREQIKKVTEQATRKCYKSTVKATRGEDIHDLQPLFNILKTWITGEDNEMAEVLFLRGSGLMLMTMMTFYYSRVLDPDQREIFADICFEEFTELLRHIRDLMLDFYDYIEDEDNQDGRFEAREA